MALRSRISLAEKCRFLDVLRKRVPITLCSKMIAMTRMVFMPSGAMMSRTGFMMGSVVISSMRTGSFRRRNSAISGYLFKDNLIVAIFGFSKLATTYKFLVTQSILMIEQRLTGMISAIFRTIR